MSVTNIGKTRALVANGDLSAKKYYVVYQDSATTVALASTTQNAPGYNLFILQNEPADEEVAELLEVGSGNSYAIVGDASAAIGAEMMISSAGKLIARTGTGVPAIARMRVAVTAANQIVEVDTIKPGGDGTLVATPVTSTAATLSLTAASHADKLVVINAAAGCAVTLPAATGTGNTYKVIIGTTITSNSTTIKAASATDSYFGFAYGVDTDAEGATGYTWNADSGDDTVTMAGSANGGIAGDYWTFTDFASAKWLVEGHITQSGASEATPFSATVS